MTAELRSDREVVLAAIDNDLRAFRFADTDLRSDEQMKEAMCPLRGAPFDHSWIIMEKNKTTDISDFNKAACTVNHDTAAATNGRDVWLSRSTPPVEAKGGRE